MLDCNNKVALRLLIVSAVMMASSMQNLITIACISCLNDKRYTLCKNFMFINQKTCNGDRIDSGTVVICCVPD